MGWTMGWTSLDTERCMMAEQGRDLHEPDSAASDSSSPGGATRIVGRAAPAGWYPDPWLPDHHRYWTGETWGATRFPSGPAGATDAPWAPPTEGAPRTTGDDAPQPVIAARAARRGWPPRLRALTVVSLVIGLIIGFAVGLGVTASRRATGKGTTSAAPTIPVRPSTTAPGAGVPGDPTARALAGLVIGQSDLPAGWTVQVIPGGDQVSGQPTLDVCNGTFPSESLRTTRLQVVATDAQAAAVLSTEAVLYESPAATVQAFGELRSTAASCPTTPAISPVGEPTVTTRFNPAPDATWPQVATVDRLAFDVVTTDQSGQSQHVVCVYLRRGRALMGLYFDAPDATQPAVNGQTTTAGIVNVFATRLAQLPGSIVGQ